MSAQPVVGSGVSTTADPLPAAATNGLGLSLRRRGTGVVSLVLPPFLVFLVFLGAWILGSQVLLDPSKQFLLPPPWDVVDVGFLDGLNRAELLNGLWLSAKAAAIGAFLSIVIGMGLAVAMSQAAWVERALFPYAVVLQTIPILALVPLIGFTLGYDFSSRVLVCLLISLFPIVTNTLFGLLSAEQGQHDLFTLHKAGRLTRLFKLQLPAAMPAVFTGFRVTAGAAVVGAVVGDFFFKQGDPGIGQLINLYVTNLQSEQLYAGIILSSLLGVVVFVLVGMLEKRTVGRWHDSTRGSR